MSRTHKDRPWWLSEWYEPDHYRCVYDLRYRIWHKVYQRTGPDFKDILWDEPRVWRQGLDYRECDLPSEPVRGKEKPAAWRRRHGCAPTCTWSPIPDADQHWWRYTERPSRVDRHNEWWHPDRARTRDWCTKACKEYNGSGDVNDDLAPLTNPRRHPISGRW